MKEDSGVRVRDPWFMAQKMHCGGYILSVQLLFLNFLGQINGRNCGATIADVLQDGGQRNPPQDSDIFPWFFHGNMADSGGFYKCWKGGERREMRNVLI
jgi:hypothetical protein